MTPYGPGVLIILLFNKILTIEVYKSYFLYIQVLRKFDILKLEPKGLIFS
jgi:hypothetical protein